MEVEKINGMIILIAENGKCLVRKGEEQKVEDNYVRAIYLAKSLSPADYEEKDIIITDKKVDDGENQGNVSENE